MSHITNWDDRFISVALLISTWSKDPNTKVGCVLVNDDHNQLSSGYNGFPRNVKDSHERLHDRDTKLKMIVHAEANAVAAAARHGCGLQHSTAYITLPPCSQCAALLVQAGVKRIVFKDAHFSAMQKWGSDFNLAQEILREAGVRAVMI